MSFWGLFPFGLAAAVVVGVTVLLFSSQHQHQQPYESTQRYEMPRRSSPPRRRRRNPRGSELRTILTRQLLESTVECFCSNSVTDSDEIYSCVNCYIISHLECIRKWSRIDVNGDPGWFCPHCRHRKTNLNLKYICYCGRTESPPTVSTRIPHACGLRCSCGDLCHPGPCDS